MIITGSLYEKSGQILVNGPARFPTEKVESGMAHRSLGRHEKSEIKDSDIVIICTVRRKGEKSRWIPSKGINPLEILNTCNLSHRPMD
jgi:hypothetical protein